MFVEYMTYLNLACKKKGGQLPMAAQTSALKFICAVVKHMIAANMLIYLQTVVVYVQTVKPTIMISKGHVQSFASWLSNAECKCEEAVVMYTIGHSYFPKSLDNQLKKHSSGVSATAGVCTTVEYRDLQVGCQN